MENVQPFWSKMKSKTSKESFILDDANGNPAFEVTNYYAEADMTGAPSIKDKKKKEDLKTSVKYDKHMGVHAPSIKPQKEDKKMEEQSNLGEGKKKGLWDNIHAKRKRGEKPAKKGDKDYPDTLDIGEGMKQARKNVGADKCWDGYKAKGTKKKDGKDVPNCVKEGKKTFAEFNESAWQRKEGKNKAGGLNEKGRKSYERENPGSDLKAPQPEGGPRKKSFCARMGGMKGPMKDDKGKPTRKALALRKWKC